MTEFWVVAVVPRSGGTPNLEKAFDDRIFFAEADAAEYALEQNARMLGRPRGCVLRAYRWLARPAKRNL
jgi:hypothetical protein